MHPAHRSILSDAIASLLASRSKHADLVRTGVHELGHAVVCHRHGVWVKEVLVGREALVEAYGEDGAKRLLGICRHDGDVGTDGERGIEPQENARICAAGAAAEALAFGTHPMRSWGQRDRALRERWLRGGRANDHSESMEGLNPETSGVFWRDRDVQAGDFSRIEGAWSAHRQAGRESLAILAEPRNQSAILALLPKLLERGWLLGHEINEELGWHRLRAEGGFEARLGDARPPAPRTKKRTHALFGI